MIHDKAKSRSGFLPGLFSSIIKVFYLHCQEATCLKLPARKISGPQKQMMYTHHQFTCISARVMKPSFFPCPWERSRTFSMSSERHGSSSEIEDTRVLPQVPLACFRRLDPNFLPGILCLSMALPEIYIQFFGKRKERERGIILFHILRCLIIWHARDTRHFMTCEAERFSS